MEKLEDRMLLATSPHLLAINPNVGDALQTGQIRTIAPTELAFRFDANQKIDPSTLDGIRVTRAGFDGAFGNANDVAIVAGFLGIGDISSEVVFRFAEALPDDLYRVDILGSGPTALRNIEGDPFNNGFSTSVQFELDLGASIVSIIPQPTGRDSGGALTQARDQIVVYFNDDDLDPTTATDPDFYQLIFTNDTVTNTDDTVHSPTSIQYDPVSDMAVLTFASDLDQLSTGPGTYRLRIGSEEILPPAPQQVLVVVDPGSSFSTADNLGTLGSQSQIISSAIDPQIFTLDYPGSVDEPGHRDILAESHVLFSTDVQPGITTIPYNFKANYGRDPDGNELLNLITETQKQRAREGFELYSYYIGAQFVETVDFGFTIVTGDMRAIDREIATGAGGIVSITQSDGFGFGTAILDNAEVWDDSFGGDWFQTVMDAIGKLLGQGNANDLPEGTLAANAGTYIFPESRVAEPVFPGDHDIVHSRFLHRPEGNDIDIYRFQVQSSGLFSAETFAERRSAPSLLDTALSLYRQNADGSHELLARNDDYYSEDSFLQMELSAGTYFVGVSSSGNTNYNPAVGNSGSGGTSEGSYDLRLNFRAQATAGIVDLTGRTLDGNNDGTPGGVHNFWLRAQSSANTFFVDKSAGSDGDGSLASPYNNIPAALSATQNGDIVRIVGNGGDDGNPSTQNDNFAYEIGLDPFGFGQPLTDGVSLNVPQGVTVMIDAGAIFKLRQSRVAVGSSSVTVDRSAGALQVLGTPVQSVTFTSLDDKSIGIDTYPATKLPEPGDWGGLIFRNDLDRAFERFTYQDEGIFLNYANFADIRYGGGNIEIDSVRQIINPIHILKDQPTISFNIISNSADAAMSATPNSFEETNFHAPQHQSSPFTSDYDRVGPDIHGNRLLNNTVNGMFVRIKTPAGNRLEPLQVSARFDDTDIVHVVGEVLLIGGTPGGLVQNDFTLEIEARFDARLAIDPGIVVKLSGSRIEVGIGAQLIAEGLAGQKVVFTSLLDDRYGAGGTFDTNDDGNENEPTPGNWGGIVIGHVGLGSIDHAVIAYGGGGVTDEGSLIGFNAVEIHQGEVRLTNSVLEFNNNGLELSNKPRENSGTIFVRGAQPIIANNTIRGNVGPAININANSLNHFLVPDYGRSTAPFERITQYGDNQGPLVRGNRLIDNTINGMRVRGGTLTTESVWDDTDIVHVLFDTIVIPNFHTFGGLRLESGSAESLVVKLRGDKAGFTASGRPLDIDDRIGGSLQIIGQPGYPVVLTSITDDTVGAGFDPQGNHQTDTASVGGGTRISAPAIHMEGDLNPNIDRWFLIADDSGRITTEVFAENGGTITLDGKLRTVTAAGETTSITLAGVEPGSEHVFTFEAGVNYRPDFRGVSQVYVKEDRTSPNDVFNSPRGNGQTGGSAFLLGFDTRFDDLPSAFADTTWYYRVEAGDKFTWTGYMDEVVSNGADAVRLELFDPNGLLQDSATIPPLPALLGAINGTTLTNRFLIGDSQAGFWSVRLTAAADFFPVAGQYLMDVEITDFEGRRVPERSQRHYLFPDSILSPPKGTPGNWRGILLDNYSHDRNVDVTIEDEPTDTSAARSNGIPQSAQFVGLLAPNEKSGDENRRLGFDIHGFLSEAGDVDVYSFTADAETLVWLDIDRTTGSLDSVVELIDSEGGVIARSDDSPAEEAGIESRVGSAQSLELSAFSVGDLWTTNPADAGMRVVLPGPAGTTNTYHVRVRSSSSNLDSDLAGGLTSGAYQLQIRLREVDEIPGSTIRFSDIRFATTGIELRGLPGHSPLVGESTESNTHNDNANFPDIPLLDLSEEGFVGVFFDFEFEGARFFNNTSNFVFGGNEYGGGAQPFLSGPQQLGNVLSTDRGGLSVAGTIETGFTRSNFDEEFNFLGDTFVGGVDWYQFEVTVEQVQSRNTDVGFVSALVFDLDYADALGRADAVLSVYDRFGRLILFGNNSSVAEDRPGPLSGADTGDLKRGSFGALDPFIGTVELAAGDGLAGSSEIYFVAVSSNARLPAQLQQFLIPGPPPPPDPNAPPPPIDPDAPPVDPNAPPPPPNPNEAPINPFVRLEPINSINRIAEDHIGSSGGSTFEPPEIPVLLDSSSVVPFHLGDISLFVLRQPVEPTTLSIPGLNNTTIRATFGEQRELVVVNPFTGAQAYRIPTMDTNIRDVATRFDGQLFGFTTGPLQVQGTPFILPTDSTTGGFIQIDSGTGVITPLGDDGVVTFQTSVGTTPGAPPPPPIPGTPGGTAQGFNSEAGILYNAITFFDRPFPGAEQGEPPAQSHLFAVGDRGDASAREIQNRQSQLPFDDIRRTLTSNILYEFDPDTGRAFPDTTQERIVGAGTGVLERGFIDTIGGTLQILIENVEVGDVFTLTIGDQEVSFTATGSTPNNVASGLLLAIDPNSGGSPPPTEFRKFEPTVQFGRLVLRPSDPTANLNIVGSTTNVSGGENNQTITVEPTGNLGPGGRVTGLAFVQGTLYAVSDEGGLFRVSGVFNPPGDVATITTAYIATSAENLRGIEFAGLVAGPRLTEGGRYSNMLFAIDTNGVIYGFDTRGELQPVFVGGNSTIATGLTDIEGLALSNLDRNLWHITDLRREDPGHGLGPAIDGSRSSDPRDTEGGLSFYFGAELQDASGNVVSSSYDFAGGAHGSLISNPFSLEGYTSGDEPVLYFNYFLETDGTNSLEKEQLLVGTLAERREQRRQERQGVGAMRDSFRVFILDESGEWNLIVTNNSFRGNDAANNDDEFDDLDPNDGVNWQVQEAFDNTDNWRQIRVPLSPVAGQKDLRLRFEFSTSGGSNLGSASTTGSELRAVDAVELEDSDTFRIDNDVFEFDLGYTFVAPTGDSLSDGETFTVRYNIEEQTGETISTDEVTFEFDDDNIVSSGNVRLPRADTQTASDIARIVEEAINVHGPFGVVPHRNGNRVNLEVLAPEDVFVPFTASALLHPNTAADFYATTRETDLVVDAAQGLLVNDKLGILEGKPLTIVVTSDPSNGTITAISDDGSFTYSPDPAFIGTDSFVYLFTDGVQNSLEGTVTIDVLLGSDPFAVSDLFEVIEDGSLNVLVADGILANDFSPGDLPMTAALVTGTGPTDGTLTLSDDGSFTYLPDAGFFGTDGFTYTANNGLVDTNEATVTITVEPIDDVPEALSDSYSVDEDGLLSVNAAQGVLANDFDPEGDTLTARLVNDTTHGTLNLSSDGSFSFAPDAEFFGDDSFTYIANDGSLDSAETTVTITITSVLDPPVAVRDPTAVGDSYVTDEDTTIIVNVAEGVLTNDSDADGDPLTALLVSQPTGNRGLVVLDLDGSFTYTPAPNVFGTSFFRYKANDGTDSNFGTGDSNTVTVFITVNPVNDAGPSVVDDDSYFVDEDNVLTVDAATGVLANDSDFDGDPFSATLVDQATNGIVQLAGDGSFTYTPNENFFGTDSFTYNANDGDLESARVATVTITVDSVLDLPLRAVVSVAQSPGALLGVDGSAGIDPSHIRIPINLEMTSVDVADAINTVLEDVFTGGKTVLPGTATKPFGDLIRVFGNNAIIDLEGPGATFTPGNSPLIGTSQPGGAGPRILVAEGSQLSDGQIFTIFDGVQEVTFEFDQGALIQVPEEGGGLGGIADGELFRIFDTLRTGGGGIGVFSIIFEFDSDGISLAEETGEDRWRANRVIPIQTDFTMEQLAEAMAESVNTSDLGPGITATHIGNGLVSLTALPRFVFRPFTSNLAVEGEIGASTRDATPVPFRPDSSIFEVGQAMINSINLHSIFFLSENISFDQIDFERVTFLDVTAIAAQEIEAGPLRLADSLRGDEFATFVSSQTGADNDHQGVFIDDLIIGFAERGEMVTGATPFDNRFVLNPLTQIIGRDDGIFVGEYQLEIRSAAEFGFPVVPARPGIDPTFELFRGFDTNARLAQNFSLFAPIGANIIDGQTFQIGDGDDLVTFEFDDLIANDGVAAGNFEIDFDPSDGSDVIATRIRDAIADPETQLTLDVAVAGFNNSPRVDLFGNVIVDALASGAGTVITGDLRGDAEPNDTLGQAILAGLTPGIPGRFIANGFIGDNENVFIKGLAIDVDIVAVDVVVGDQISVDIDAQRLIDVEAGQFGSPLDSVALLFDAAGNILAGSDDDPAPDETGQFTVDSYFEFIVPATGTYYVGVSSYDNFSYDPFVEGSGEVSGTGTVGFYRLEINTKSLGITFQEHNDFGDENVFRDQGQILIQSNRISDSLEFGIVSDAGPRDGIGLNPHIGPPRNLAKLNTGGLVPGVTIMNNIIDGGGQGGILLSGDPNFVIKSSAIGDESPLLVEDEDRFRIFILPEDAPGLFLEEVYAALQGPGDAPGPPSVFTTGYMGDGFYSDIGGRSIYSVVFEIDTDDPPELEWDVGRTVRVGANDDDEVTSEDLAASIVLAIGFCILPGRTACANGFGSPELRGFVPELSVAHISQNPGSISEEIQFAASRRIVFDPFETPFAGPTAWSSFELGAQGELAEVAQLASVPIARVVNNTLFGFGNKLDFGDRGFVFDEPNDTLAESIPTGLSSANPGTFFDEGNIGDNPAFPVDSPLDIDVFHVQLDARDRVTIDTNTRGKRSSLDTVVRVFDAAGNLLAENDNGAPIDESQATSDSYLDFKAPAEGQYFIELSGSNASSGDYDITITVLASSPPFLFKDAGILIDEKANATLLNNIVSNFDVGIKVDGTSAAIVGGGVYKSNIDDSNIGQGSQPFDIADDGPLFVDPLHDNFRLVAGSLAIDSSIESLEDRPGMIGLKSSLGIPVSPILAPDRDLLGQFRADDPSVETTTGKGENIFKDRGAVDRADGIGPVPILLSPMDNDVAGIDQNSSFTIVQLASAALSNFAIQVLDPLGVGVDDSTVTAGAVSITRDDIPLVEGVDYAFTYDTTNNIVRLTPLTGSWLTNRTYVVTLVDIRDVAGNVMLPNRFTGQTQFTITLDRESGANGEGNGGAESWQNPRNPLDVNDDGFLTPIDVLLVVNEINNPTVSDPITNELPDPLAPPNEPPPYFDVTGDGFVSPIDALLIINGINLIAGGEGEIAGDDAPEGEGFAIDQAAYSTTDTLEPVATQQAAQLAMLADDEFTTLQSGSFSTTTEQSVTVADDTDAELSDGVQVEAHALALSDTYLEDASLEDTLSDIADDVWKNWQDDETTEDAIHGELIEGSLLEDE